MRLAVVWAAIVAVTGAALPAFSEEDAVIGEVLGILLERGIVDEDKYKELVAKNERYEQSRSGLLGRIELTGDFRGRLENFWYENDGFGNQRDNRHRGRYRLRLQGKARVNEHVDAIFRLASGQGNARSSNTSFGDQDDFAPDSLFIDRAYIEVRAPGEHDLSLRVGRMANPLRWKHGADYIIWDPDVSPEGVSASWKGEAAGLALYTNAAYFVFDENSTQQDPHLLALQGGFSKAWSDDISFGGRASLYRFGSLGADTNANGIADFNERAAGFGNVSLTRRAGEDINAVELGGWIRCACSEDWPLLIYGHFVRNLSASSRLTGANEDTGWGLAFEVGDKRRHGKLGIGYYKLETDYFPALTIDSDATDFRSNRKGFTAYGSREVWKNTDLRFSFFIGDAIQKDALHAASVSDADRMRLRTDIVVSF